jgi:hypothetical protein
VRVSQQNSNPLQHAIKRLVQGKYYAERTAEVLGKSEAALDGFVGPAMNIMHDDEVRDVSRRGEELSLKLRKSARYLDRGQKNQEAFDGALKQALPLLDQAVSQATLEKDRQDLKAASAELGVLAGDPAVESSLSSLWSRYENEGQPRLAEVQGDKDGVNVSRQGRPLWDLFENSMVDLSQSTKAVQAEQVDLESVIARLRAVESRSNT